MSDKGVVNIRGKEYQTVAKRVADFRAIFPAYCIENEIISNADAVLIKSVIKNEAGLVLSTGYAEEIRDSSNINKTSAIENCETSAVGRSLAFLGYGGEQIASANEVNDAVIAGAKKEVVDYMAAYAAVLRDNLASVVAIRAGIESNDLSSACEAWRELGEDIQRMLWLAPSKGGIFTTQEREIIKSSEFRLALTGEDNE
jgi:hypothetical protein